MARTLLMAANYRRLGRASAATKAIAAGVIGTSALIGVGFLLPARSPGFLVALVPLVIMTKVAKALQGAIFDRHKLPGGKVAST